MKTHEPVPAHDNNADKFTPDDSTLESIDYTAQQLGCCRRTIYELIVRGELRSVHVGKRHMIPRGERLRFIRDQLENKQSPLKKFQELQYTTA